MLLSATTSRDSASVSKMERNEMSCRAPDWPRRSSKRSATCARVRPRNSSPRDARASKRRTDASSGALAGPLSSRELRNCTTSTRTRRRDRAGSFTQQCGRFNPMSTKSPSEKRAMRSPTKRVPWLSGTSVSSCSSWQCQGALKRAGAEWGAWQWLAERAT